jgi:hypothetical protein
MPAAAKNWLILEATKRLDLSGDEAQAILQLVGEYSFALDVLDDYDHERMPPKLPSGGPVLGIDRDESMRVVAGLRTRFGASDLFRKGEG